MRNATAPSPVVPRHPVAVTATHVLATPPMPAPVTEPVTEPLPPTAAEGEEPTGRVAGVLAGLSGLTLDVGLPLAAYYGLHAAGVSDAPALLAATLAAGLRVAVVAVHARRISPFAALMLGVYAVGLVFALVSGDPHVMLLKDSATTVVVGAGFLISLASDRPMLLTALASMRPAVAVETTRRYRSSAAARRTVRALTTMWGVGLLAEAAVRIPLVYSLPIDLGVGLSHALTLVVVLVLAVVSAAGTHRVLRTGPRGMTGSSQ